MTGPVLPTADMKNKRKEVGVGDDEEGAAAGAWFVSDKRSKFNVTSVQVREDGDAGDALKVSSFSEMVQRTLEARRSKGVRPFPVLLGDKVVDLFALSIRVSSMGGYSKVTEAGLWGGIADALGLGLGCGPGLKLVYVKYLKALESGKQSSVQYEPRMDASNPSSWEPVAHPGRPDSRTSGASERSAEKNSSSREAEAGHENGDCSPVDQHRVATEDGSLTERRAPRKRERESGSGGASMSDEDVSGDQRGRRQSLAECRQATTSGDWAATYASVEHLARNPRTGRGDDGSMHARGSDVDADTSDDWYEGAIEESCRLQREALGGMLEWMRRVALKPGTPSAGLGAEGSGQDEDWVSQCLMLTAKVRSVLWKELRAGDGYLQAKQTPSLYYEEAVRPDPQTLERLRATRERLAYYGFQPLPGPSNSGACSSQQERNDGSHYGPHNAQRSTRQPVSYSEMANPRYPAPRKRIPIGPDFQANELPWVSSSTLHTRGESMQDESSGVATHNGDDEGGNDSRNWLGVRIWPLPGRSEVVNRDRIGRGRPPTCDCSDPESMDCVRLHIEMAREELRAELEQAFYHMGFDQMGECVANQWSKEEEERFRLLARTNPASLDKNFWDHLPRAFPSRTKKELVSYYFNVFVLRRRALQNRLEGQKVDSDDDEAELPDESDESSFASMDEEEEEEEEEDPSEGADDVGGKDIPDAYPLRLSDGTGLGSLGPLTGYNYSSTGGVPLHGGGSARAASSTMGLEEAGGALQRHDPADSSHIVLRWDDKHLEAAGSLVRDEALQQGRQWEEAQWDVRDHQQVSSVLSEAASSRQSLPPAGKEDPRQSTHLGELWSQHMEMGPKRDKDKLLSTNGMILELFGDDVRN